MPGVHDVQNSGSAVTKQFAPNRRVFDAAIEDEPKVFGTADGTADCAAFNWRRRKKPARMIYSTIFNGELQMLETMLYEVYPLVDVIVVVQSNITFSGLKNNATRFEQIKQNVSRYLDKIRVVNVEEVIKLEMRTKLDSASWFTTEQENWVREHAIGNAAWLTTTHHVAAMALYIN